MEFHDALARGLNQLPQPAVGGSPEPTELMAMVRPAPHATGGGPSTAARALLTVRTIAAIAPPPRRAARVGVAAMVILLAIGMPQWTPKTKPGSTPAIDSTAAPINEALKSAENAVSSTGTEAGPITTVATERAAEKKAAATIPPIAYTDVKLLVVDGPRTKYHDTVLQLSHAQIDVKTLGGHATIATVPFARIGKATYVHARDPRWDSSLAAPTWEINIPGIFGRSRHWLVVQTKTTYTILRLGEESWREILQTFEARSGRKVDGSPIARENASKN